MIRRILCAFGFHKVVWSVQLDHDKRARKVYSVRNFRMCKHCRKELGE